MPTVEVKATPLGDLFRGDWGQMAGAPRARNQWPDCVTAPPGDWPPNRMQVFTDTPPAPWYAQYAQYYCLDTDVSPLTPTTNPRAQTNCLVGIARQGEQVKFFGSFRCPYIPSFSIGFFQLAEWFQYPFTGSPAMALYIQPSTGCLMLQNALLNPHQTLWVSPSALVAGQWYYFELSALLSTNAAVGWMEFAVALDGTVNAVPQQLNIPAGGTELQLPCQTIITGGVYTTYYLGPYRTVGMETASYVHYAGAGIDKLA